jgi:hypothetical protein
MKAIDVSSETTSVNLSTLSFAEPKSCGKDACLLCAATFVHDGKPDSLTIRIPNAKIVRLATQKGSATVQVKINKPATKFMVGLDERCLHVALEKASVWFMHKVKTALIEDFFKPSTEVSNIADGITVRYKLAVAEDDMVPTLTEGHAYDLTLRLLGLQFRKQHFSALWSLTSVKGVSKKHAADVTFVPADDASSGEPEDAGFTDDDIIADIAKDDIVAMCKDTRVAIEQSEARHAEQLKIHKTALSSLKIMKQKLISLEQNDQYLSTTNINLTMKVLNSMFEDLADI